MNTTVAISIAGHSYDVQIGQDWDIKCLLQKAGRTQQYIILHDAALKRADDGRLLAQLISATSEIAETAVFAVPSGEPSKSLSRYGDLLEAILAHRITRDSIVIAFGGGVIGDLGGFVAASLLRGLRFIQMPTTLLAQVDSSVGGKVGINAKAGKNLIGAFHQPVAVVAEIKALFSLSDRVFSAGMAEVIKAGLLADEDFVDWLDEHRCAILARKPDILIKMVARSVQIKADVVQSDVHETLGRRALLNLGHTFGHGLEALCHYDSAQLMHGEAVSIGTVMAAQLSADLGMIDRSCVDRVIDIMKSFGLPSDATNLDNQITSVALWQAMQYDKKNSGAGLKLILLESIGNAVVRSAPDTELILAAIDQRIRPK